MLPGNVHALRWIRRHLIVKIGGLRLDDLQPVRRDQLFDHQVALLLEESHLLTRGPHLAVTFLSVEASGRIQMLRYRTRFPWSCSIIGPGPCTSRSMDARVG